MRREKVYEQFHGTPEARVISTGRFRDVRVPHADGTCTRRQPPSFVYMPLIMGLVDSAAWHLSCRNPFPGSLGGGALGITLARLAPVDSRTGKEPWVYGCRWADAGTRDRGQHRYFQCRQPGSAESCGRGAA